LFSIRTIYVEKQRNDRQHKCKKTLKRLFTQELYSIKMKVLLIIIISVFNVLNCLAQNISITDFQKEIEITKAILLDLHPSPLDYQSNEKLSYLCDSLKQENLNVDSISILYAYQRYAAIVSAIKCSHSGVYLPGHIDSSLKHFPFKIRILEKQGYIIQGNNQYDSTKFGDRIISINDLPMETILKRGIALHSAAGLSQLNYKKFEKSVGRSIAILMNNPNSYKLTLARNGSDTLIINSIPSSKKHSSINSNPFTFEIKKKEEVDIALFTIHNFPTYKQSFDFELFCEKNVKLISRKKIKNVVIDLRDNGGGDYIHLLLRYFASESFEKFESTILRTENIDKYKKNLVTYNLQYNDSKGFYLNPDYFPTIDYQGKMKLDVNLYVLVNGYTASAASHFAALVKEHKLGTIVGNETGGKFTGNNGTAYGSCFLPYSGIEIYVPLAKNVYAVAQHKNSDNGVIPDIKIKAELKKDLEMDHLIKIIIDYKKK
jgi:C-terminal processing protease CtpA/Prc